MQAFLQWLKAMWAKVHGNPYFVTATSLFLGALGKELYTAYSTGAFDWSPASLMQMVYAAFGTMLIALYHLYIQPPNPTVPATIPPSPQVEQVAAELKPVNPAAVPVEQLK
jgi:hypothetical protein